MGMAHLRINLLKPPDVASRGLSLKKCYCLYSRQLQDLKIAILSV